MTANIRAGWNNDHDDATLTVERNDANGIRRDEQQVLRVYWGRVEVRRADVINNRRGFRDGRQNGNVQVRVRGIV